jgi:hypothetical protein
MSRLSLVSLSLPPNMYWSFLWGKELNHHTDHSSSSKAEIKNAQKLTFHISHVSLREFGRKIFLCISSMVQYCSILYQQCTSRIICVVTANIPAPLTPSVTDVGLQWMPSWNACRLLVVQATDSTVLHTTHLSKTYFTFRPTLVIIRGLNYWWKLLVYPMVMGSSSYCVVSLLRGTSL